MMHFIVNNMQGMSETHTKKSKKKYAQLIIIEIN